MQRGRQLAWSMPLAASPPSLLNSSCCCAAACAAVLAGDVPRKCSCWLRQKQGLGEDAAAAATTPAAAGHAAARVSCPGPAAQGRPPAVAASAPRASACLQPVEQALHLFAFLQGELPLLQRLGAVAGRVERGGAAGVRVQRRDAAAERQHSAAIWAHSHLRTAGRGTPSSSVNLRHDMKRRRADILCMAEQQRHQAALTCMPECIRT